MTIQRGQRPNSDFSVGQLTLLGVIILLFFAWTYVAFAEEVPTVPTFNLHKTCKTDVLAYQGTTTGQASGQVSEQGCLRSEQSARETLVSQWTQFSPANRRECLEIQGDGATAQSYVELLTCLQMASPDKNFK